MAYFILLSLQFSKKYSSLSYEKTNKWILSIVLLMIHITVGNNPQFFNECGGSLKLGPGYTYGILTNPNYPTEANRNARYPNDADCVWTLEGDEASLMQVKIWDLQIELGEGGSNITCDYDYLKITITSMGSKKFCGAYKPEEVIRGMGSLRVQFVSDDNGNYRGFQATFQEIKDYNPCVRKSPCVNGDCEFIMENQTTTCKCFPGATGKRCDEDVKECQSNPCLNGGICSDDGPINTYSCACLGGWKGQNCEIEPDSPCVSEPCKFGGKCSVIHKVNFTCNCSDGYTGHDCAIKTGCGNPGLSFLHPHRRFNFGTTLNFSCIENYILKGPNISTCQKNGSWTNIAPDCIDADDEESNSYKAWTLFMIATSVIFLLNLIGFLAWMNYYKIVCKN